MTRFIFIGIAYLSAFAVAVAVFLMADGTEFEKVLYADIAATLVVFGFSVAFKNSSFYDAYWSVAPIAIALTLFFVGSQGNITRELLVLGLVTAWGIRLTWNWAYGWQGLKHEDWRYVQLQEQAGVFYWLINLLGIHLFPTAIVFLGCIAMFAIFSDPTPLNLFDLAGAIVMFAAIALEAQADRELHRFRAARQDPSEVLKTGVWSWCRHPNYLGEIGFWVGLFLFGVAVTSGEPTDAMKAGPISMIILFVVISIPMIDKKLTENKPSYAEHKQHSFALLPLSILKRS